MLLDSINPTTHKHARTHAYCVLCLRGRVYTCGTVGRVVEVLRSWNEARPMPRQIGEPRTREGIVEKQGWWGRIESQIRQLDRRNGFEEEIVEENVVFWELQEYCIINGLNAPFTF